MPKTADRTGGVRLHRETPPNPAWVRASRPAGWPPQQPVRRPRGRLWRQGYRTPGRCGLSDRVARQPRSMRRHPQSPAFLPFGWHSDPRREQLWRGPEQSGVQRNGLAPDPTPTGRRYGSCGHSLLVRIHAYLSCSTISYRKEALHHNYRARTRTMSFFDAQKCEGRARTAFTADLIRSTMSGSRVLTVSHEYVLYWPKLALRSQSVFTCSAKHAPAKANAKAAVVIAHNFNRILFSPSLPCWHRSLKANASEIPNRAVD